MSQYRSLIEQHYQHIATADEEGDRQIFSPDVVTVVPGAPPLHGIDAFLAFGRAFHTGFPDGHMEIQSYLESGNRIAIEGTFVGTHTGPMVGPGGEIPPTERRLALPYADFFEVENGRIIRHQIYFDQMAFLAQLGLMPEPEAAGAPGERA